MKKYIFVVLFTFFSSFTTAFADTEEQLVVVIHSYAEDFKHTSEIKSGIDEEFSDMNHVIIKHEYMDTKNYFDEELMQYMFETYRIKYSDLKVDAVIVSDNNAMTFVDKYKEELFSQTDIFVATNVTLEREEFDIYDSFILFEEIPDYKKNINLIYDVFPATKTLHVIRDNSTTSDEIMFGLEAELVLQGRNYEIVEPMNAKELTAYVEGLDPLEDAVLWTLFFRDYSGNSYSTFEVLEPLSEVSPVPIFGMWEFYLGKGIAGGHLISSRDFGIVAAKAAIGCMTGVCLEASDFSGSDVSYYYFDYPLVKKYNMKNLPEIKYMINSPLSFISDNKEILIIFGIISVFLLLIILFQRNNIEHRKMVEDKNRKIIDLNEELIDTQKEIVERLGDMIESRSNETHSHVVRMSKISRFIGEKLEIGRAHV